MLLKIDFETEPHITIFISSHLWDVKKEYAENPVKSRQDNHLIYSYYDSVVF